MIFLLFFFLSFYIFTYFRNTFLCFPKFVKLWKSIIVPATPGLYLDKDTLAVATGSRKVPSSPSSARSCLAISEPLQSKSYVFFGSSKAAPEARSMF